jgi:hypothetical protein
MACASAAEAEYTVPGELFIDRRCQLHALVRRSNDRLTRLVSSPGFVEGSLHRFESGVEQSV